MTLDGDWQFKGWLGDEWRWHVAKPWDAPGWLPARVPGSVVDDLMRAGEVPDVYFERNSRLAEWAAERTWVLNWMCWSIPYLCAVVVKYSRMSPPSATRCSLVHGSHGKHSV